MGRIFRLMGLSLAAAITLYVYTLPFKVLAPIVGSDDADDIAIIKGVERDLTGIANAEHTYLVMQGKYASMEELACMHLRERQERAAAIHLRYRNHGQRLSSHGHSRHERRAGTTLDHRGHASQNFGLTNCRSLATSE